MREPPFIVFNIFFMHRAFKGDVCVYVGEWQADTGTPKFERLLLKKWQLQSRVPLPNWGSTAYCLMIWVRQGSARAAAVTHDDNGGGEWSQRRVQGRSPMPCAHCGQPAERRCRFCHAVAYCSASCAELHAEAHARTHALRGVELPPQTRLGTSSTTKVRRGEAAYEADTHYAALDSFRVRERGGSNGDDRRQ